ncbi:D-amino acid aminotransferase [Nitrosomonas sp.]|uniref:D-amino acid aminotransferase n=1 Tax=Nitrosomonas sp. TaxID=42353 RepID=UPI00207DB870|nr:D-amino acid aminotransferase [Nitrosomonas sp.]GJL75479.1 MAG: cytochrome c550 [Nitrosomonas sp.]
MIFLNGHFMPIEKACISVLDRGFIFGDGVYEVIPVYSRKPFRLVEHLHRLQHSLDGIRLKNPYTDEEWHHLLEQIIAKNKGEDQSVYLHITRGVAKRDHAFPDTPPTVFIMSNPLLPPPQEWLTSGVAAVTTSDNRWIRCDIKSISLLPNVLLRQIAVDAGAIETILVRDGFLTEGSASNIFVVKDQILLTPPKSHLMLPGITYDVTLELAAASNTIHEVREITEDELFSAEEVMLTSSTREIMAITRLNDQPVGNGKPGPKFRQLHQLYQQYKATHMRGAAVN